MQNSYMVRFSGYSMCPFLKPGDRLIIRPIKNDFIEVGDIVLRRNREHLVAHRLVRLLPDRKGILKGDSLLKPDPDIISLSELDGRVEALIRDNRLVSISKGKRSRLKKIYATLSLHNLTYGSLKLRLKQQIRKDPLQRQSYSSNHEWIYLVSLLCDKIPLVMDGLNWGAIEKLAYEEGVSGALYYNIKKNHLQPPILPGLKRMYESIAARNFLYLQRLEEIENALSDDNIEVLVLKGASLFNSVYKGIGMRSMGDLDLMVRPEEKKGFERLLQDLGYMKDLSRSHLFKKEGVSIDLHIHALNTDRISSRTHLLPSGMEPVLQNSIPLGQGFVRLRKPDDVDNILLLSQHLMKHSFSSLIWIYDIYELLKDLDSTEWRRLSDRAKQFKQQRCLTYSLYLIRKLFGYQPPKNQRYMDILSSVTVVEKVILDVRIQGRLIGRIGPLFSFFCINGLKNRINYVREALFPGTQVVAEEFRSFSGTGIFLFYLHRFFQALSIISIHFFEITGYITRGRK